MEICTDLDHPVAAMLLQAAGCSSMRVSRRMYVRYTVPHLLAGCPALYVHIACPAPCNSPQGPRIRARVVAEAREPLPSPSQSLGSMAAPTGTAPGTKGPWLEPVLPSRSGARVVGPSQQLEGRPCAIARVADQLHRYPQRLRERMEVP